MGIVSRRLPPGGGFPSCSAPWGGGSHDRNGHQEEAGEREDVGRVEVAQLGQLASARARRPVGRQPG